MSGPSTSKEGGGPTREDLINLYHSQLSSRRKKYCEPNSQEHVPPTPIKKRRFQKTNADAVANSSQETSHVGESAGESDCNTFHKAQTDDERPSTAMLSTPHTLAASVRQPQAAADSDSSHSDDLNSSQDAGIRSDDELPSVVSLSSSPTLAASVRQPRAAPDSDSSRPHDSTGLQYESRSDDEDEGQSNLSLNCSRGPGEETSSSEDEMDDGHHFSDESHSLKSKSSSSPHPDKEQSSEDENCSIHNDGQNVEEEPAPAATGNEDGNLDDLPAGAANNEEGDMNNPPARNEDGNMNVPAANEERPDPDQNDNNQQEHPGLNGNDMDQGQPPGRGGRRKPTLSDLIHGRYADPIDLRVDVNRSDVLYMALGLAKQNYFTNKAFSDSVKLVNNLFNEPVLPVSSARLDSLLLDKTGVRYFFYCSECLHSFGELDFENVKTRECENCDTVNVISDLRVAHYFCMFDLRPAIKTLLCKEEIRRALLKPSDAVQMGEARKINDIYSGSMYKEFTERVANYTECIISLLFCTDGAALWSSSSQSISVKNHGGYYSCNWCCVRGTWLPGGVKYPMTEVRPQKRSHEEMLRLARNVQGVVIDYDLPDEPPEEETIDENDNQNFGVQDVSPLINVPMFDMVNGFFVEPMHLLHLGIAKKFLLMWLESDDNHINIHVHEHEINARIAALRPPLEFRRMPRKLVEKARWNAREFDNWLSYCSVPVLSGILMQRHLNLWMLFVQAVYLLNQSVIEHCHVNTADALLKHFLCLSQDYYGVYFMVYNMHLLCHLAEHVARWGNLWAASAYCFENFNGFLLKIIRSQQGIPNQVLRALSWRQALDTLEPHVSHRAREYVRSLPTQRKEGMEVENCVLLGKASMFAPTDEEKYLLRNIDFNICEKYPMLIRNRCVFSSPRRNAKKNNSVAQLLRDNSFVQIRSIVHDRTDGKVYILVSKMYTQTILNVPPGVQLDPKDHFMYKVTHVGQELQCILPCDLKVVCFRATFHHGDFVAPVANICNVF